MDPCNCQIQGLPGMADGTAQVGQLPVRKRLRLFLKRKLGRRMKRSLKTGFANLMSRFSGVTGRGSASTLPAVPVSPSRFQTGDLVRIRSEKQIEATLSIWQELKGCKFLPEMHPYCDTIQRVLKPVERFVDERDYQVKKSRGVYLLEGMICQGTSTYGRCDRACFYFWRDEWLDRIDELSI